MKTLRSYYYQVRDSGLVRFFTTPRHPLKAIRTWRWKRKVNRSIRILDELDWNLRKVGWSRQQRRRFWREFNKKQEVRTEVFNKMTQGRGSK